jgi:protein-S-isoprenylcysteine O-methyltransferase Ste14
MGSPTPPDAPRSSNESDAAPPGTILAPSPILTLVAFLLGIGIEQIWASTLLLSWTWMLVLGLPLIVGGSLLFGGAIWTMRAHDKHPSHSDEPPEVIRAGPYQYSRNPIYVGHSLVHVGASVLVNSVWPLVTLVPLLWYLRRVVQREERRLAALFGEEYDRYRQDVRRWL